MISPAPLFAWRRCNLKAQEIKRPRRVREDPTRPGRTTRPEGGKVMNDSTPFSFNCKRSEVPEGRSWNVWTEDGSYSEDELRGIWGNTLFSLAGMPFREPVVRRCLEEVLRIETTGQGRYGLVLRREPENRKDPKAIAVGFWAYDPSKTHHFGYLWRKDAATLAKKFRSDMPLACKLCRVFEPEPGKLWVGFQILIPSTLEPGWIRTRQKKSDREEKEG